MAGADNDNLFGTGLDLSGGSPVANKLDEDGKVYWGSTLSNPGASVPTSVNNTVVFHGGSGTGRFENRRWVTSFVVDPSASEGERGTYQTFTAATAAASSGDTILSRPGTYTEDFTAKAGVHYQGFGRETERTIINGTVTLSESGKSTFEDLSFTSNSATIISHTGSNESDAIFFNCFFSVTDAQPAITSSNTNSSSSVTFHTCNITAANASAYHINHSGTAQVNFFYSTLGVDGNYTTSNVLSSSTSGFTQFRWCYMALPLTTSNNHKFRVYWSEINPQAATVLITHNSTATSRNREVVHSSLRASTVTSSAISIGASATLDVINCVIESSNATTIAGSGTIRYAGIQFVNTQTFAGTLTTVAWTTKTGDIILDSGASISEFSTDGTLAGNSDTAVPTEKAVKTYVDASAGGGAWTLISSTTASDDATIDFTGLSSTYYQYMVVITDLVPATDGTALRMRTSTDNGTSYDNGASDYSWGVIFKEESTTASADTGDNADTDIQIGTSLGNDTNEISNFIVYVNNPSSAAYCAINWFGTGVNNSGGARNATWGSGTRLAAADVDAIRFFQSSGNITSGIFKLYGLAAS